VWTKNLHNTLKALKNITFPWDLEAARIA